jgi:hypothetical protein
MKTHKLIMVLAIMCSASMSFAQAPAITGSPEIDGPNLLDWPLDFGLQSPSLIEPTANKLNDFHGEINDCDMVLSTPGNYHMALKELWVQYLEKFPANEPLKNWYYTTSPPISVEQIPNNLVQFGNMYARCRPQVAVGPKAVIDALKGLEVNGQAVTKGESIPVIKNYGSVLLVKKNNPKGIKSIWDLGKKNIKIVTSNPDTETGSFTNYKNTIYDIAKNDSTPPSGWDADKLFNSIFNSQSSSHHGNDNNHGNHNNYGNQSKWISGERIHHREVPWSIAYGKADVGIIFYHLALYIVRTFPDKFEIVPLGGTADDPQPLLGNNQGTMHIVRIDGDWTSKQLDATEKLIESYMSDEFTEILQSHGLRRPAGFQSLTSSVPASASKLVLYPNPASKYLEVDFSSKELLDDEPIIKMFDRIGSTVMSDKLKDGKLRIDTSKMNEGQYFIHIQNGNEIIKRTVLIGND